MLQTEPLKFDYSGALNPEWGVTGEQVEGLSGRLESIRDSIFDVDLPLYQGGAAIPPELQPLDTAFVDLPERLLDAYEVARPTSEVSAILRTAKRLQSSVDRIVVLGIGGSYLGARALVDTCCDPYFNELPAGHRGGRPKIYFAGNNVDNDSTQGLLHLLRSTNDPGNPHSRWGMIVISKSGGTLETAVALRQFINAWRESFGDERLGEFLVPVTGRSGKLSDLADSIGCPERFPVPDGVGGRFSVFSAVGLLPAAVMGIDIVKLLNSAAWMNDHFRRISFSKNLVLQYVAVNHLLESLRGCHTRVMSVWSNSLETTGLWYDQLFAESIGKAGVGALPLTVVNTRDLHSRAQQHQQGRRDKVMNNVVLERTRTDPVAVGKTGWNDDGLDGFAGFNLPQIMDAAIRGTNEAYREGGRPTTTLTLPVAGEAGIGQVMQMLMLATVVECRLVGVNPYGQPGVEDYKKHMQRFLAEKTV